MGLGPLDVQHIPCLQHYSFDILLQTLLVFPLNHPSEGGSYGPSPASLKQATVLQYSKAVHSATTDCNHLLDFYINVFV